MFRRDVIFHRVSVKEGCALKRMITLKDCPLKWGIRLRDINLSVKRIPTVFADCRHNFLG